MSDTNALPPSLQSSRLAVIGLGYVGLPLAAEFGKFRKVIGYDTNEDRVLELRRGYDATHEMSESELRESSLLTFSTSLAMLEECNVYIVTVPTPIDENKLPICGRYLRRRKQSAKCWVMGTLLSMSRRCTPGPQKTTVCPFLSEGLFEV